MSDQQRPTNDVDEADAPVSGAATEAAPAKPEDDATTERGDETTPEDEAAILRARVGRLEEENRRLRERYAGAREKRYVRTALGLGVVGAVFGLAGVVVTSAQEVLFAIAAAGLFGAVLTRYLTPEQFIPLDIGEGIYAALADNEAGLTDQLGLSSTRVYLTTPHGPRLFVPELESFDRALLDEDVFDQPLVVSDTASRSGASFRPAAEPLLRAFEEQHRGDLPAIPREAVATLREGVTDALELAGGIDVDLDSGDGRVTFSIEEPLYGEVTNFDHPLASFLGTGLATALGTPVEVDVVTTERDGDVTPLVTCRWDPEAVESDEGDTDTDVDADADMDMDTTEPDSDANASDTDTPDESTTGERQ